MAAAAASRLQSALASYRKVSSGGDVTEAVASLERAIVAAQTRGIGSCTLGQQPQAATVAAALAFNAGCGAGITAMARAFKLENNIAGVRRLADRLATRAYLWEAGAEASAAGCSTTPPPVSSPQSSANGGAAIDSSLPSPARSSPLSPPPRLALSARSRRFRRYAISGTSTLAPTWLHAPRVMAAACRSSRHVGSNWYSRLMRSTGTNRWQGASLTMARSACRGRTRTRCGMHPMRRSS